MLKTRRRSAAPVPEFSLPLIEDEDAPGANVASRAVSGTLLLCLLLAVVALLIGTLFRVSVTVRARGVLEPLRVWQVRALETGIIKAVLASSGDTVHKGDDLVQLDSLLLAVQLDQLRADYREKTIQYQMDSLSAPIEDRMRNSDVLRASAELLRARATLRARLVDFGLGSDVDSARGDYKPGVHTGIDMAMADLQVAEADAKTAAAQRSLGDTGQLALSKERTVLKSTMVQIRGVEERLARLSLVSPASGVVLTESLERLPGTSVEQGDVILEISDLGDWRAELAVRQEDLNRIEVGDSVKVDIEAFEPLDAPPLRGRVTFVGEQRLSSGTAGNEEGAGSLYRVLVRLDPAQIDEIGAVRLRRGYSVEGRIVIDAGTPLILLWHALREHLRSLS